VCFFHIAFIYVSTGGEAHKNLATLVTVKKMRGYCNHLLASMGLLGLLIGGLTIGLYSLGLHSQLYDFITKKV
jgi:hypothetical protein